MSLTIKQEKFCQAYVRLGDKSAAYREAYRCSKMKPETINNNAYKLFDNNDMTTRIDVLQREALERNNITVDELIKTMTEMVRFDISDLYDENGALKNIHDIPKEARRMISQIEVIEHNCTDKEETKMIGRIKKIRTLNKIEAIEKLMKHLGGYKEDNKQRIGNTTEVKVEFVDFSEDKKSED